MSSNNMTSMASVASAMSFIKRKFSTDNLAALEKMDNGYMVADQNESTQQPPPSAGPFQTG